MASPTSIHAEAGKTAEGEAVVDLLLYLAVAQTVPHTHECHAEQHHAVVARMPGQGKALGIGRLYQGTERMPVYHGVYLVEEPGFHLVPLHLQVAETQLGCLFLFHALKINNQLITNVFCRSFAEVSVVVVSYRFEVSWGPAELYERKYLRDRRPDTFYHPVKYLGIVDGL